MKALPNMSLEYIRNEISLTNLYALLSVEPPYRGSEDEEKPKKASITHFEEFNF